MPKIELIQGDCLEKMKDIPDGSIDAIITDPPYGTTACKWDSVIPFQPMWEQLKRIIKPNGAIVLFGSQPFTSALVMSNPKMFKYEWVWDKVNRYTGYGACKTSPLKRHENLLVFGGDNYFPQMTTGKPYKKTGDYSSKIYGTGKIRKTGENTGTRYPYSILSFKGDDKKNGFLHPTQKPVALMEYLIKTYTNEGETVLDFTMGSGTTGLACINTGRDFIGIEKEKDYFLIAKRRINDLQNKGKRASGYWAITELGEKVVRGGSIPKWVQVYNNKVIHRSLELVSVRDAIGYYDLPIAWAHRAEPMEIEQLNLF